MMRRALLVSLLCSCAVVSAFAQQMLGSITGTVSDASGSAVVGAAVTVRNVATNLEVKTITQTSGSFQASNLPIGNYTVTFSKVGFKTETHTAILVQGDRTTTVPGRLEVGAVATTVEVTATPLLNQTDTTTGYVLDSDAINNSPLGTGSFTQLAIFSPGLSADFLNGSGSNAGLGNQAIFANGQRDTSNSISINGASADNLFNGKTTSGVPSGRFTLSTGESFQSDNSVQTSGSVYDAAGQSLPTPAPEMMQELRVNAGMYDVSQGGKSGAQIETITKSGTNQYHGQVYEHLQNTAFNAAPFFRNASPAYTANNKVPALHYDRVGGNVGGPIIKDKLFFFIGYQYIRDTDALGGQSTITVPLTLTNDRSPAGLAAMAQNSFGVTVAPSAINPAANAIFNAKVNGQYLIPTPFTSNPSVLSALGYDAVLTGASTFTQNQGVGDFDYVVNQKERLSAKLYYQDNPTTSPFGGATAGFPKATLAGAPSVTLSSTTIVTPTMTWENRAGIVRQYTYVKTDQPFTPGSLGIDVYGSTNFPSIEVQHSDPTTNRALTFGPSNSPFSNAGFYQNNFDGASIVSWVKGRHTLQGGITWTHSQLNVLNNEDNTAFFEFTNWTTLMTGNTQTNGKYFAGTSNRYYRADTAGAFIQDRFRVASNVTVTAGVRWDYDGPLREKYGNLTNFDPAAYQYNLGADTIVSNGIVVAGNNKLLGTPGVSNSTMTANQWNVTPRIGVAWTPSQLKNVVVRAGVGMYSDRGEYFTYFSPPAGSGFNGPFGVTLAQPFVQQVATTANGTISEPFTGTTLPAPITSIAALNGLLPNGAGVAAGKTPYLIGAYDMANKLPYTENWTFDLQWQPTNSLQMSLGYVGNHGVHQVLPIPFNQPGIATASNPINGQTVSYGFNVVPSVEPLHTFEGGNTTLRAPYLGIDPNSPLFEAEGISNYNALQFGLRKRLSHGLQVTAAYTYSHTLDEQSNLGLFFEGNNPLNIRSSYGTSTYDRPHVAIAQVYYELPRMAPANSLLGRLANGWAISGITTFQSGLPYDIYDYSGSVGGLYYSNDDELNNPVLPLKPGITVNQAKLQGTTGINPSKPLVNSADFYIPTIPAGTMGVPACLTTATGQQCDNSETVFGNTSRNLFRSPFQRRLDISIIKTTRINERFSVRFQADAFNITNTPSFDAPNNGLSLYSVSNGVPTAKSIASQTTFGVIQNTIGSPRFLQLSLSVVF
jgi:Carboxypeptidase regulatory-like domain